MFCDGPKAPFQSSHDARVGLIAEFRTYIGFASACTVSGKRITKNCKTLKAQLVTFLDLLLKFFVLHNVCTRSSLKTTSPSLLMLF
eukprot:2079577-Amphidinium_carterae.1